LRLLALSALLWSCNLVNSDLTKTQIQLPIQMYQVDTADHNNVKLPPSIPTVQCSSDAACCPTGCQGDGFTLGCSGTSCQATVSVTLVSTVDLSTDPSLTKAMSFADVTLKNIEYGVCMNTLTVAVPQIDLWLAPQAVTKPDPAMGATKIGTIPMVSAMTNVSCPPDPMHIDPATLAKVTLTPEAQAAFKTLFKNPQSKFNAIAVGTFVVKAGDPTPMGAMTVYVSGVAEVSF
jgi:hypothetical protein